MIKTISAMLLGVVLTIGAIAGTAQANGILGDLWNAATTMDWKDISPTVKYQIETKGNDVRTYHWTPPYNKYMSCFMVFSKKGMSSQCYDVDVDERTLREEAFGGQTVQIDR